MAQGPLVLSLSLMGSESSTLKPLLDVAMKKDASAPLRLGYARSLIGLQLIPEALTQLSWLNEKFPEFADGWLVHGLLLFESKPSSAAAQNLETYIQLTAKSKDPDQLAGRVEALLALSQIAQRQGQLERAKDWLKQMPANADPSNWQADKPTCWHSKVC